MKKTLALLLASVVWLSGCSGRTDDDSSQELEIAAAQAAVEQRIRLRTTESSLLTGSLDLATIVAIVTDDQNRVVADADIEFSSDGGVLQNISTATDDIGQATAKLGLAGDYRNRNITVTATMAGQSASIMVAAKGTRLSMVAPETIIMGDSADLEFTLLAGNDIPIPNQSISFQSAVGNTFSQNSAVTDANGMVSLAASTVAGEDIVTAITVDDTVVQQFALDVVPNVQAVETPIRIRVISNESNIETGGNDIARITTLVTDENNRVISGKEVEFSSTGGVLQNISAVTNAAGQANAELSLAGDFRNQEITVTAMVDDEQGSVLVATTGSSISVSGPTALVSGNTAELEVSLTGGNDQPIANEVVSISTELGNTLSAETVTTDSAGKASVVVGSTAGSDTITFKALDSSVEVRHELNVAADILSVVEPASFDGLIVDEAAEFKIFWESSGVPVGNADLKINVSSGLVRALSSDGSSWGGWGSNVIAETDANGIATVEVNSTAAGLATLAFAAAVGADPKSQVDLEFIAIAPATIEVEANPASVGTGNPSTIVATIKDLYGNPVEGAEVEFSGPVLLGGSLSQVAALTDNEGKARVTFTAGQQPTAVEEIIVEARVVVDEAAAPDDASRYENSQTRLTVTEQQLNVIIGLAGSVTEADTDTRYRNAGLVQVTDGAGRPVADATISMAMVPTVYRYGYLETKDRDGDGEDESWGYAVQIDCIAEDTNGNRVLDTDPDEDINGNGILDPNDPGLVDADKINGPTVIGGQITTDSNGVGFFSMAYPQSNAWWFEVELIARVQALGVEGVAVYSTGLAVASNDVSDVKIAPPNFWSPYGQFDPSDYPADQSVCFNVPVGP